MLKKYIITDFELSMLDNSRKNFIKKIFVKKNTPFFFNLKFYASFFFLFSNIINIDKIYIERFFLVFWLFTGSCGSILNFKVNLRLGINYYHFFLKYNIKKRKFYIILSFLFDDFLINQKESGFFLRDNSYILFFNDLEILTNYKLARGVYFHRIQQKFFFKINFLKNYYFFFNIILNSLKFKLNKDINTNVW